MAGGSSIDMTCDGDLAAVAGVCCVSFALTWRVTKATAATDRETTHCMASAYHRAPHQRLTTKYLGIAPSP